MEFRKMVTMTLYVKPRKMVLMNTLQNSNGDADIEIRLVDVRVGEEGGCWM